MYDSLTFRIADMKKRAKAQSAAHNYFLRKHTVSNSFEGVKFEGGFNSVRPWNLNPQPFWHTHTHTHGLRHPRWLTLCFAVSAGPSPAPVGWGDPLPPPPASSPGCSRSLPDVPAPSLWTTNRIARGLGLCSGGGGGSCQKQQQELQHCRPATQGKKTRRGSGTLTPPCCPSARLMPIIASHTRLSLWKGRDTHS